MPPEERDPALLWDMREAAREVADLILSMTEEEFPAARTRRFAVERLVLVLGEAAVRVSESYRLQNPDIPWNRLQRLRNMVAHTYGQKVAAELYLTCTQVVVPLALHLESVVRMPPPDDPENPLTGSALGEQPAAQGGL